MKIISKFKDYYDWCASKWGIDPNIIYERHASWTDHHLHTWYDKMKLVSKPTMQWTNSNPFKPEFNFETSVRTFELHICDVVYIGSYFNGSFYFDEQLSGPLRVKKLNPWLRNTYTEERSVKFQGAATHQYKTYHLHLKPSKLNQEFGCPLILKYNTKLYKNPILKEFGMASILPAEELFLKLTTWLTPLDKIGPDSRTDEQKRSGHGLDQEAFRNTGHRIK